MDVTGEAKQKIKSRADPEQATDENRSQQKNREALLHQLSRFVGLVIVFIDERKLIPRGNPKKRIGVYAIEVSVKSGLTYAFSQTSEL